MISTSSIHTTMPALKGKRIFITGGTTGIGRAIANLLGSQGTKIFTCGRHRPELNDALESIRSTGASAAGELADLSTPADIQRIFKQADQSLGGLDIFINNAAVAGGGVEEEDDESWRYIVETNLLGYIGCAKEAIRRMKSAGKGHIVLIGSMSADLRTGGSSIYAATKSGIQAFAEALRKEVNPEGIKVSLIEPGKTGSDMVEQSPSEQRDLIQKHEMLRAEDIAVAVHYVLTQPARCDVVSLQIRPHLQLI
jgi:NADP-dependent 3-hydroxy acid dehydrogenase YdfG